MSEYDEQSYRKRPVVIQARRMRGSFTVQTMEGPLTGKAGDWLITGVSGEQYPCDDAIFRRTYDRANSEASDPSPEVWTIHDKDGCLSALGLAPPKLSQMVSAGVVESDEYIVVRFHGSGAVVYRGLARDYDDPEPDDFHV